MIQRLTAKNEESRAYFETAVIDNKISVTCFMEPHEDEDLEDVFKIYLRVDDSFFRAEADRSIKEIRQIYSVCTDLIKEILTNLKPGEIITEDYCSKSEASKIRVAKSLGFEVLDDCAGFKCVVWTAK